MVFVRVCLTGHRDSIPRQRELLEPNARPHQITVSTFDLSNFKPEKTWRMTEKKNKNGNDNQHSMSPSIVVCIPVCHTGERGTIPRTRELLEAESNRKTWRMTKENESGNDNQHNVPLSIE